MSRINDLLRQLDATNPDLAKDLRREVDALADRRAFGLNFERHQPEAVELPGRTVRRGDKVHVLPPRGENPKKEHDRLWQVVGIDRAGESPVATLETPEMALQVASGVRAGTRVALTDLVVVAEFLDPIYPGLVSNGRVERGGDKPFHTVINAENYHALQTLLFTHRGKIDCIYIDPPYNTGARDWKYNNNYVEGDDLYRHSKWLAFMERRIRLAKDLLDPNNAVLIVAIDEKEYLRLGLLLEQIFDDAKIQMITSVIKAGGTSRTREFSRVEEFLYFVFIGESELDRTADSMLLTSEPSDDGTVRQLAESDLWEGMIRRGLGVIRSQREGQFYPIFINADTGAIDSWGAPLGPGGERDSVPDLPGLVTVWPIKDDLTEGFWQLNPGGLTKARDRGTVRVGSFNEKTGQWRIQYMKAQKARAVEVGLVATLGKDSNGVVILDLANSSLPTLATPRTVWNKTSHDASTGGAGLLNRILPGRKFPFAKSLYAVEDAIRFFVSSKPDAVVLDFFSGSGTTAHAVLRLNKQDDGRRRSISITNNELGSDTQRTYRQARLRPGDPEWEGAGIFEYITMPRIKAAISGITPDGAAIKGVYKYSDEFPMSDGFQENVEFFSLTYEAPLRVSSNREFPKVAPLLWMRAGSQGRRIDSLEAGWDIADTYGVVADLDQSAAFLKALIEAGPAIKMVFIVTDEDRLFTTMCRELPDHVEPVRLYEAYLRNFEIETGRGAL